MAVDVRSTPATVEVVEELTDEEVEDRHRLELKVERAFFVAGKALAELRERKLYRSTHKNFEEYCYDRFAFQRAHAYRLIESAAVVDNLSPNGRQNESLQTAIGRQILPTNERQVRPLTTLEPDEQREVWQQAVEAAGGKIPSSRIVQGIVERLKERDNTPPLIPFQEGDVILIRGLGNSKLRKYDGQWAIALSINEYTVTLAVEGKDVAVQPQFLEPVDPKCWAEVKSVNERITRLQLECDLDPMEDAGLEVLRRRTSFTPKQMMLLKWIENNYGISTDSIPSVN